jgi:hypothetical protein
VNRGAIHHTEIAFPQDFELFGLATSPRRARRDHAYIRWRGSKFERAGCGASTAKSLSEKQPATLDDVVNQTVARALELLDVAVPGVKRWDGGEVTPDSNGLRAVGSPIIMPLE